MTKGRYAVVVLGARFGGLTVVQWLAHMGRRGEFSVTVVDPQAVSVFRPGLVAAMHGKPAALQSLRLPVATVCRRLGARWIQDWVVRIDPGAQKIHLASHRPLSYDVCFWATGADASWEAVSGLGPEWGGICELPLARHTAQRLSTWHGGRWVFASGPLVQDPAQMPAVKAALDSAPVEAALIADMTLRRTRRRADTDLVILTPGPVAGEWLGAKSQALLARELKRRRIQVLTGVKYRHVAAGRIVLADRILQTDAMTWIPAYNGSWLARVSGLDDGWGWVPTHPWGQHLDWPTLYAVGDLRRDGLPKLAHRAMQQARGAVRHWMAVVRHEKPPQTPAPSVLHVMNFGGGRGLFTAQNTLFGGNTDWASVGRWPAWSKSLLTASYLWGGGWLPVMP